MPRFRVEFEMSEHRCCNCPLSLWEGEESSCNMYDVDHKNILYSVIKLADGSMQINCPLVEVIR
jgi:hypothetical protein